MQHDAACYLSRIDMLRERRGNARALAGADTECRLGAVALERAEGERAERSYQID